MGILNVTPDSFSDAGQYFDRDKAIARGKEMEQEGADIIDVGGESTRPGNVPVSEEEETRRVIPVIESLAGAVKIPISIDTWRSGVARRSIEAGAQIVNDISGLRFDSVLPGAIRDASAAVVLMHSRGTRETLHSQPKLENPIPEMLDSLAWSIETAKEAGISNEAIVLDPGFGFGKPPEHGLMVLKRLSEFSKLRVSVAGWHVPEIIHPLPHPRYSGSTYVGNRRNRRNSDYEWGSHRPGSRCPPHAVTGGRYGRNPLEGLKDHARRIQPANTDVDIGARYFCRRVHHLPRPGLHQRNPCSPDGAWPDADRGLFLLFAMAAAADGFLDSDKHPSVLSSSSSLSSFSLRSGGLWRALVRLHFSAGFSTLNRNELYDEIILAVNTLASNQTGALIVIERDIGLKDLYRKRHRN